MAVKIPTTLVSELIKLELLNKKDAKAYEDLARKEDKELGQIFIEKDVVSAGDLLEIKSRLYYLPIIKLEEIQLDSNALKELSEEIVAFYKIAPFAKEGNVLKVGILNPEDIDALEALKFIASDRGLKIEKYVIDYRDFEAVLRSYRSLTAEVGKALESLSEETDKEESGVAIRIREEYTYGMDIKVKDEKKIDELIKICKELIDKTKNIVFK